MGHLVQLLLQQLYFVRYPPQVVRASTVGALLRKLSDAGA